MHGPVGLMNRKICLGFDNFADPQPQAKHPWRCAICSRPCYDGVFGGDEAGPRATWIANLPKFSRTLSQCRHRRELVQTFQMDLQTQHGWEQDDGIIDLEDDERHTERWRWYPRGKLKKAMESLTKNLNHLLLARALFTSMCFQGCCSPRLIQTMGMTLPFLLVLPRSAINKERPLQHHVPDSTTSGLRDLDCTFEADDARIDLDSHPPLVLRARAPTHCGKLVLYHYIGPTLDLEDLLGAPRGLEPYRRWLTHQPAETFQSNSVRTILLRLLRSYFNIMAIKYTSGLPGHGHDAGHQVIGDPSALGIDKTLGRLRNDLMPQTILLQSILIHKLYDIYLGR